MLQGDLKIPKTFFFTSWYLSMFKALSKMYFHKMLLRSVISEILWLSHWDDISRVDLIKCL